MRSLPLLALAALLSASTVLMSGCAGTAATATTPAATAGADFSWENQALESAGRGNAPKGVTSEPQRSMTGKQAAKTVAITALKRQVASLPVDEEHTVGFFMDENLGIKRAIETHVQAAQTVSEKEVSAGTFEVRARTDLRPIANILRQYHITPTHLPPPPPETDGDPPRLI